MTTVPQESKALAEHFFRQEYAKMVAVITRYFGLDKVNMAEDIVQDTLVEAISNWEYKGIPENPEAWLYTVAKNKALNLLKRDQYQRTYKKTLERIDQSSVETIFSEEQIADDQLRMMFACCHPAISQESQVSLMLKTLCGLSIGEIASAFLTSNETINKRLVRARKTLKEKEVSFDLPDDTDLDARLDTVLKTIFLLFNEGYSASKGNRLIKYELCLEAIRLTELVSNHSQFARYSGPNALLSLMLLNASRFKARVDGDGNFVRMVHQDRSLWNQQLISRGLWHLQKINESEEIGLYHILAAISAYHCTASSYETTDWPAILKMYDALSSFDKSPLVQLNRAIALAQVDGAEAAIKVLLALENELPPSYYLFHSTLADLYIETGDFSQAISRLEKALQHAEVASEIEIIKRRIANCQEKLDS
ncbi:MAG: sigma-70 family RNA polymerase sigma factor [Roseivirga sp.]|nr:sigma-70 family RNA polymerase sigma factor [Roseivirga sp.]